jgi:hypothetical protein
MGKDAFPARRGRAPSPTSFLVDCTSQMMNVVRGIAIYRRRTKAEIAFPVSQKASGLVIFKQQMMYMQTLVRLFDEVQARVPCWCAFVYACQP